MSDPCDYLAKTPLVEGNPDLRRRILDRTLGILRRRRWLRRVGWASALAACYGAGVVTTQWIGHRTRSEPELVRVDPSAHPAAVNDKPRGDLAEKDEAHSLVRAADHLLIVEGDPLTAMHGYVQALEDGGNAALTISTDDSWLMMALKDARQKEKRHAKNVD